MIDFNKSLVSTRSTNMNLRVQRKFSMHGPIALGLTVYLATCELIAAHNSSSTLQYNDSSRTNSSSNRWTPMNQTGSSSSASGPSNRSLVEPASRDSDCSARLQREEADDMFEAAASVMAPIERLPATRTPTRRLQRIEEEREDDQEDEHDEDESPGQRRTSNEDDLPKWSPQSGRHPQGNNNNNNNNNNIDGDEPIDQAAAEQEAAEASEAEAADRSALDEQLQQQRKIIMAQAQSEAKAIREQQEALLRQQQMQLRMANRPKQTQIRGQVKSERRYQSTTGADRRLRSMSDEKPQASNEATTRIYHRPSINQQQHQSADIQFCDQPDRNKQSLIVPFQSQLSSQASLLSPPEFAKLKMADEAQLSSAAAHDELVENMDPTLASLNIAAAVNSNSNSNSNNNAGDLHAAAQHHYGAHYGSVKGHHGDYYHPARRFAESHKKGQFHSGFKRGGKKFQVSGHASQHKSHAEGHVNWHGKKGKGVQYWDYKHKNKKHPHHHHEYHPY